MKPLLPTESTECQQQQLQQHHQQHQHCNKETRAREREREREREKKERRAFISVCQATLSTPQCPWYLYLCFFFLIRLCLFLLLFHFYFFCFFLSCCCLQLKSWLKIIALCLKLISAFIWISDWHLYRVTLGKWREHGNNEEKMERMYANR